MRRPSTVEVMLLVTIGLWSLNLTVSRYILTHGFLPLAYATVRYGFAVVVFVALTLALERSLRIRRADLGIVAAAAAFIYLNQIGFVYALERSSASVLGLILGATPIFAALAGLLLGTESLPPRFWRNSCRTRSTAFRAVSTTSRCQRPLRSDRLGNRPCSTPRAKLSNALRATSSSSAARRGALWSLPRASATSC